MVKYTGKLNFLVALFVSVALIFSCSKLKELDKKEKDDKETPKEETKKEVTKKENKKSDEALLYFCERYDKDEGEIGVSSRFSTGYLTVMVDTRPTGKTIGTGKVEIVISKIKDASGNSITEKIIKTIPFDVTPSMNYIYFESKKDLKFTSPGTYKVVCQKKDGTPVAEGEIEIVE